MVLLSLVHDEVRFVRHGDEDAMAEILMVNLPFAGHTNPTLPLTESLVRRGHHVAYINAEEFRGKIEKTGAHFIPYQNYPASPTMKQTKSRCFEAAFDTAVELQRHFDLLIYEMFFYPGKRVADLRGIPSVRQFSQPAWNQATTTDAAGLFILSSVIVDLRVMGKRKAERMGLTNRTLMDAVVRDKPELNVVYVPQVFQRKRESFGDDYVFTVPMSQSDQATVQIPYERMKPPVVYISLGSLISNKGFCKECIRAFGGRDMSVILNTGTVAPEPLGRIPANIFAYPFVPQLEVLDHADAFLTHCGMNSVNEAMSRGVPMVAMPFVNDQVSNAKRIVELGIGRRVRSFPSRGKELYEAVKAVCGDSQMRNRSREIQELVKQESSLEEAVSRIEQLVA